jgi:hypothetical protein
MGVFRRQGANMTMVAAYVRQGAQNMTMVDS